MTNNRLSVLLIKLIDLTVNCVNSRSSFILWRQNWLVRTCRRPSLGSEHNTSGIFFTCYITGVFWETQFTIFWAETKWMSLLGPVLLRWKRAVMVTNPVTCLLSVVIATQPASPRVTASPHFETPLIMFRLSLSPWISRVECFYYLNRTQKTVNPCVVSRCVFQHHRCHTAHPCWLMLKSILIYDQIYTHKICWLGKKHERKTALLPSWNFPQFMLRAQTIRGPSGLRLPCRCICKSSSKHMLMQVKSKARRSQSQNQTGSRCVTTYRTLLRCLSYLYNCLWRDGCAL